MKRFWKRLTPVRVVLGLVALLCVAVLVHDAFGQANPYVLDTKTPQGKEQQGRLTIAQQQVIIAQMKYNDAGRDLNDALAALAATGDTIAAENKWPPTVHVNNQSLQFMDIAPKPQPQPQPPAPKPPDAKKPQ